MGSITSNKNDHKYVTNLIWRIQKYRCCGELITFLNVMVNAQQNSLLYTSFYQIYYLIIRAILKKIWIKFSITIKQEILCETPGIYSISYSFQGDIDCKIFNSKPLQIHIFNLLFYCKNIYICCASIQIYGIAAIAKFSRILLIDDMTLIIVWPSTIYVVYISLAFCRYLVSISHTTIVSILF